MPELIEQYWPILLAAFLIGIAVAWFAFSASRKTSVKISKDVLDDGEGPAARNQALIDAPTASIDNAPVSEQAGKTPVPAGALAAASGGDLTQIKGLGPKLAALLNGIGITSIAQIADWDDAEIARIDAQLGRFQGRISRDNWVEQAKHLTSGDEGSFESKFGQNG